MSDGMKKSAGSKMREILVALTQNRVIAFIVGAFVTLVRTEISGMAKYPGANDAGRYCSVYDG